jgi:peroxiredoxin
MSIVTLKEGDKAPAFSGKDQNGETISLSDFAGKRVILFFLPKGYDTWLYCGGVQFGREL